MMTGGMIRVTWLMNRPHVPWCICYLQWVEHTCVCVFVCDLINQMTHLVACSCPPTISVKFCRKRHHSPSPPLCHSSAPVTIFSTTLSKGRPARFTTIALRNCREKIYSPTSTIPVSKSTAPPCRLSMCWKSRTDRLGRRGNNHVWQHVQTAGQSRSSCCRSPGDTSNLPALTKARSWPEVRRPEDVIDVFILLFKKKGVQIN